MVSFVRKARNQTIRANDVNELQATAEATDASLTAEKAKIAESQIDLSILKTQRYDVREYGTVGTSDDTATFQSAIDAAHAAGGGVVVAPAGTYTFLGGIELKDGVYLQFPGRGSTHLDFSGATSWVGGAFPSNISGEGTLSALPALNANVTRDGATLVFASDPSLAPGDKIVPHSSVDYSFSPYRDYYREGETCTARTVSSTTVTLQQRLKASHLAASTNMWKKTPIRTGITGARITGQAGKRLLRIALGSEILLEDLELSGSDQSLAWLDRCDQFVVRDLWGRDHQTAISLNYGLLIGNCQDGEVQTTKMYTTRHAFTCTGADVDGAHPNRNIRVSDSEFGGSDPAYGGDLHGNSEWITFHNVNFPNGFITAGDHIRHFDCSFGSRGLTTSGVMLAFREILGIDHHFYDCQFNATAIQSNNLAHLYLHVNELDDGGNPVTLTRTDGVLRFINPEIVIGPYMHASSVNYGLWVHIGTNTALPKENDVEIRGLRVTTTAIRNGNGGWGAAVTSDAGRSLRNVSITGTRGNLGILVNVGPKFLDLSDNGILNAWWRGVQVDWPSAPEWTDAIIVMDGGYYIGSYSLPVRMSGHTGTSDTICFMSNVKALNGDQGNLTAGTGDDGMSLLRFKRLEQKNCSIGDTQAVATMARYQVISNVAEYIDHDNELIGSLTAPAMSSVTTRHFRGRGAGAPTFAAAKGSVYYRTDGTTGSTFYVNESGSTTWTAIS